MMRTGYLYRVQTDRFGNALITRLKDRASVYLQGDDAVEIDSQLDALEATKYPCGPFVDYASHLDVILDAYESVLCPWEQKLDRHAHAKNMCRYSDASTLRSNSDADFRDRD